MQRLGLRLPPEMLALARRQGGYPLGLNLAQVARGMVAAGEVSAQPSPAPVGSR
jgi:hypothetical protein